MGTYLAHASTLDAEDLAYIRYNWGSVYKISSPVARSDKWHAIAIFGGRDILEADTAEELLHKIRRHYPGGLKGFR
jgi:hypothetical protein